MKIKKLSGAVALFVIVFASSSAFANNAVCDLIREMQSVFNTLRILAFVGAGFILASWAWDFIKGGDGKTNVMDTLKTKGISMLVGFVILFSIGIGISVLMNGNLVDCADILRSW